MSVSVCARAAGWAGTVCLCVCVCVLRVFRAMAVTVTAEDPIEKEWSQPVRPGAPEPV